MLRRWRSAIRVVALVGLTVSVLAEVVSWLPFLPPLPEVIFVLCVVGLFPAWATFILGPENAARPPMWLPLLVVAAGVNFVLAMHQLPGQPEHEGNAYFFNDHGRHRPTDRLGYESGLRAQTRLFTSGTAVFYGVALVGLRRKTEPQPRTHSVPAAPTSW
jgi:hypothetical protein